MRLLTLAVITFISLLLLPSPTSSLSVDEIHQALLTASSPQERKAAQTALTNAGLLTLLQTAVHTDGVMRAAAAEELGKLLDARAVPALLRLAVSDPYTLSRHHAVTALGKMAVAMPVLSEDIRTGLQRVREGTDVNQQWLAANALGMLGDAGVAADITRVLRVSEDPHLAWQGLHSLAAIPGPETLPVAYEFVLHPDPAVAEQALRTCFAVAVKAAEPVAVATGDGTANVSLAEVMGDLAPGAGDLALRLLRQSSKRHPHEALRHKSLLLFQDAVGVMKEKLLAYEKAAASAAVLRAEAKAAKSEL